MCATPYFILFGVYIRFRAGLCGRVVGVPMGTDCASPVADLCLYCYERDFVDSLGRRGRADAGAFGSTSRYLDDLLDIDNSYFEDMVSQIYPHELHLNKANTAKICDKPNDFGFDVVSFPFLDCGVPRRASNCDVYVSQLIRFSGVCGRTCYGLRRLRCVFGGQTSPARLLAS